MPFNSERVSQPRTSLQGNRQLRDTLIQPTETENQQLRVGQMKVSKVGQIKLSNAPGGPAGNSRRPSNSHPQTDHPLRSAIPVRRNIPWVTTILPGIFRL
jgi:hypothetical protein